MVFDQGDQSGKLTTELGSNELVLLRVSGAEHVNSLFCYQIEALSARDDQDFDNLIGTHATVDIDSAAGGTQSIDGIVTQVSLPQ